MSRKPQLYRGLNVVWVRDFCVTYHLAKFQRLFIPGKFRTLCGRRGFAPVIAAPEIRAELKDGQHNCPACFEKAKRQA